MNLKQALDPRPFAGLFGGVYLIFGLVHITIAGVAPGTHQLVGTADVSPIPDVWHVVVGVMGLVASGSGVVGSLRYAQVIAVAYGAIAALALFQRPIAVSGLGEQDILMNAAIALVALTVSMRAVKEP